MVDAFGNVPVAADAVGLPPAPAHAELSKRCLLLDKIWDDEFVDGFLALETWGNDNVSLPRRVLQALCRGALSQGRARGAAVVMDKISSRDKHRLHLSGGHVGAVVSKKAAKGLWPAMATFWADRDARA
jgi:polyhydroxyalkanoate synthase